MIDSTMSGNNSAPSSSRRRPRTLVSEIEHVCVSKPLATWPCCVMQQKINTAPQVLTYPTFLQCLQLHQVSLSNIVDSIAALETNDKCDNSQKIVLGYLSSNTVDLMASVLAATELKPTLPVLLNTRWTAPEMINALQLPPNSCAAQSTTTILLHDAHFADMALKVRNGLRRKTDPRHATFCYEIPSLSHSFLKSTCLHEKNKSADGMLLDFISSTNLVQRKQDILDSATQNDAIILFTSGTTGGSKGVRLGHASLLIQALAKIDRPCSYSHHTVMLASTVPFFHVGGLSSVLAVLLAGGSLVFPATDASSSTSFRAQDISTSMSSTVYPANTLVVVPAMLFAFFSRMDANPKTTERIYPQTRLILIGGQSASAAMLQRVQKTFPNAKIVQTYACTEAASSLTFLSVVPSSHEKNTDCADQPSGDCVGTTPSHIDLRLMSQKKNGGVITELYQLGAIATRGPHVMNGYWRRDNMPSQASGDYLTKWFVGGDLGFWDNQGRLCFGGRVKDIIRTGGESVMAPEVERVVQRHPLIVECAVFPRRDEKFGEAVACAIVTRDSSPLGIDAVKKWCRQNGLSAYKQPKYLFLVSALPRNSSGKFLKHKLIAQFGMPPRSKL